MLNWMLNRYQAPNSRASVSVRPMPPLCSSGCAAAAATTAAGKGGVQRQQWARAAAGAAATGGNRIAPARILAGPQTSQCAPAGCCGAAWATVTGLLLLRRGLPRPAGRSSCALRCDGCCTHDGSRAASPVADRACELLLALQGRCRAAGRWQASMAAIVAQ